MNKVTQIMCCVCVLSDPMDTLVVSSVHGIFQYWSGLPLTSPGDLSDPGIKPVSPALQADSLSLSHKGSPEYI